MSVAIVSATAVNQRGNALVGDKKFTVLVDENTDCYCLLKMNFRGEVMYSYGPEEERVIWIGNVSDLKAQLEKMLKKRGYPRANEAFHLDFDVKAPNDSLVKLKVTLMEVGIYRCELVDSFVALPPPPTPVTVDDVLIISEE